MTSLKLKTETKGHELIKKYLEENASDNLANKINNGVKIVKDGKTLINKKDLFVFMKYASDEARKVTPKGENSACIEDNVVYGWAIHYFEEDSIEGTLYNEDGSEFKPITKTTSVSKTTTYTPPVKTQEPSLFDLLDEKPKAKEKDIENEQEVVEEENEPTEEDSEELEVDNETGEIVKIEQPKEKPSPIYLKYMSIQNKHPNAIVAYKLGDFYEFFKDSAITASKELELTLTGRECGLIERVPMCGIPYHVAQEYFNKLSQNHEIVVIENDIDVRVIKKYISEEEEIAKERELMKAFDKDVLIEIMDIFGDEITLE